MKTPNYGRKSRYASPATYLALLVFVLEINVPKGTGNGLVQQYGDQIASLYDGKSFLHTSGAGTLMCEATQVDLIGDTGDGRDLYRANVILSFRNLT